MRFLLAAGIAIGAVCYLVWTRMIPLPAFGSPVNARVFPTMVGIGLLLAAIGMIFEKPRVTTEDDLPGLSEPVSPPHRHALLWLGNLAVLLAYILCLEPLGYILSSFLVLAGLVTFYSRGRWGVALVFSALFVVATYLLFDRVLRIPLPDGVLTFLT